MVLDFGVAGKLSRFSFQTARRKEVVGALLLVNLLESKQLVPKSGSFPFGSGQRHNRAFSRLFPVLLFRLVLLYIVTISRDKHQAIGHSRGQQSTVINGQCSTPWMATSKWWHSKMVANSYSNWRRLIYMLGGGRFICCGQTLLMLNLWF